MQTTDSQSTPSLNQPSAAAWDAFVQNHPQAAFLQLAAWGQLKSAFGWSSRIITLTNGQGNIRAGALLLFRRIAGLTFVYVPRGPLTDWADRETTLALLARIDDDARQSGAAFVKIEPSLLDTPTNRALMASYGFRPSPQTVQPPSTITLDISAAKTKF